MSYENERDGIFYTPPNKLIKIFIHPSYYYIESLLEKSKIAYTDHEETIPINSKMTFYDTFNREYEIEMRDLVNDIKEGKVINKLMKYTKVKENEENDDDINGFQFENEENDLLWQQEIIRFREKLQEES